MIEAVNHFRSIVVLCSKRANADVPLQTRGIDCELYDIWSVVTDDYYGNYTRFERGDFFEAISGEGDVLCRRDSYR